MIITQINMEHEAMNETVSAHDPLVFDQYTFAAGSDIKSVALGYVDNDNDLDIAVANGSANTVSVLLNTRVPGASTPSFTGQSFATGYAASLYGPKMAGVFRF
jgi:hypothetical protein